MNRDKFIEKAQELAESFELKARLDHSTYITTKENTSQWVEDLVFEAHKAGGFSLPDDTRYEFISAIANTIALDCADRLRPFDHDYAVEIADCLVAHKDARLSEWLASNSNRFYYVDQALEEGLIDGKASLFYRLQWGQYLELLEIADVIIEALNRQASM